MATVEKNHEPVIIRAFGEEPVQLMAVSVRDGAVDAVGSDESRPMPFRVDFVYRFDKKLFRDLRQAYEAGDGERLSRLWKKAEFYTSPSTTAARGR